MPPQNLSTDQAARLLEAALDPTAPSSPALSWTPPSVEEVSSWFPEHTVEALIGRGAMGAVYRAVQNRLGRLVAIKLLPAELATAGDFAARFEREARAMAQLSHPNIVAVHDFGRTAAGHAFIVMEHVEGADLSQLLRESPHGLTVPQALGIVGQICDALQYAHGRGCIHRDVKPQNVLVTPDGHVKIADFGLAKLSGIPQSALGMTATGTVLGTPEYVAPEQLKGGAVDHRADIYSLGVMFYEMLTGDLPRGAWEPPSERVPAADTRLDDMVRRAMQREPDRRYQQCSEVKTDVGRMQSAAPPAPKSRRRTVNFALGALMLATGAALLALSPTRDVPNALLLLGPFALLAVAFALWRRPVGAIGGLIAGLAVAAGTTLAVPTLFQRVHGPPMSEATQAEVSGLLSELLNAQEELDAHRGLEGDEFQPGTIASESARLAKLRQRVVRLAATLPEALPAKQEIAQRWSQVERDVERELAAVRNPAQLAELASQQLEQLARVAASPAADPFAPALSADGLDRLVSDYGVAPTDPRLVKLRELLAQQQELPELAGRITDARNKLVEATNTIQALRWDKLEPEQRATLTERWNALETEADALRKHRLAIDVTELPSLIRALDDLRAVRPEQAAAASGSSPQ